MVNFLASIAMVTIGRTPYVGCQGPLACSRHSYQF